MKEQASSYEGFLRSVKSFLLDNIQPQFESLRPVVDAIIKQCDMQSKIDSSFIEFIISHLCAIRHYIKVKEGRSLYLQAVNPTALDEIIEAGEKLIIVREHDESKGLIPPSEASIITRQDDPVREQKLAREQFCLDDNPLFHDLLMSIWVYLITNKYLSKKIFISYAWPIGNVHEEAWTKAFVEKLAYHFVFCGFQVYLDDIQGGAGYPLDVFMEKLKKVDHILLVSSRTMRAKLARPESGVSQEKTKILEFLESQSSSFRSRVVIPVLLNYSNYCDPLFASLAEVPMCVEGYLGSLMKLVPRLVGDSKYGFEAWFDRQLKKEQISVFEGIPRPCTNLLPRESIVSHMHAMFSARHRVQNPMVVLWGDAGVGKTEVAIQFCHSAETKRRYKKIYWVEASSAEAVKLVSEIHSQPNCLVVFNDVVNFNDIYEILPHGVDTLVVTQQELIGLPNQLRVAEFSREEAQVFFETFLWNKEVHKPEYIELLINCVGQHPAKLHDILIFINQNKLNAPRYLKSKGFDDDVILEAITRIEILDPELNRNAVNNTVKKKEEDSEKKGLVFKPSEQIPFWHIPMQNPNFTGRTELLNTLHSQLTFEALDNLRPVALTNCDGMGGIGKTQVAIEYVHRYRNNYRFVAWIPAESSDRIETAFFEIARYLKIAPEKATADEIVEIVKRYLIAHPGNLLVFDGAKKFGDVERFIPETGNAVLMTSQLQDGQWPRSLSVPLFSPHEWRDYVRLVLGERATHESDADIDELCGDKGMGGLPLAIAQAVAYIWVQKITISEYIRRYREMPVPVLSSEAMPVLDKHIPVYTTFNLATKALEAEYPLVKVAFFIMCFLSHEEILGVFFEPINQFRRAYNTNTCVEEIIGVMAQYSLITISSTYKVGIHQLLQQVVRMGLTPKLTEAFSNFTFELLKKFLPYGKDSEKLTPMAQGRILLPHAERFVSAVEIDDQKKEFLLDRIEFFHGLLGNARKRKEYLLQLMPIKEKIYGPEHIVVAAALNNLGLAYLELGEVFKSKEIFKRALRIKINAYGDEDPRIVSGLVNLGNAYGKLGNERKAIELQTRGVSIFRAHGSVDNVDYARSLLNLGVAQTAVGNSDVARELYEEALPIFVRHWGPDHPLVANVLTSLGNVQRDLRKKCEFLEKALTIKKRHYVAGHPEIVITQFSIGTAYRGMGLSAKACDLLKEALIMSESHYGPLDNIVALILIEWAHACRDLGDVNKARELLERALAIRTHLFGPDHPSVAVVLEGLGMVWTALREVHKGQKFLEQSLHLLEQNNEQGFSMDISTVLLNIANTYGKLGNLPKSLELLERALKIKIDRYGAEDPDVAIILASLASTHGALGDVTQQLKLLQQAFPILEAHYSPDHPAIIESLIGFGKAYGALGQSEKACKFLERALGLQISRSGSRSVAVGRVQMHLGIFSSALGDTEKSIGLLQNALSIYSAHEISEDFEVASVLYGLGVVYYQHVKDFKEAFDYLSRAYAIFVSLPGYGPNHSRVIPLKALIDKAAEQLEDSSENTLVDMLSRALGLNDVTLDGLADELSKELANIIDNEQTEEEMEKEVLADPDNIDLRIKLADKYIKSNNADRSIFHYEAVVNFVSEDDATRVNHNLACLYHTQGRVEQAEKYFQVALSFSPSTLIYCSYGLFLFSLGRLEESAESLLLSLSSSVEQSSVVFSELDFVRLDKCLQEEVKKNSTLEVQSTIISYYFLIRCYHQLGEGVECEKRIGEFRALVETSSSALCWRLLGATYAYVGQHDNAEECEAMQMSFEPMIEEPSKKDRKEGEKIVSPTASLMASKTSLWADPSKEMAPAEEDEDEELKRAIALSMQDSPGDRLAPK